MDGPKRLIVCLDGTWNQQDSSTNVLHHYNLVREGFDPDSGLIQKKYYHPGVGTGALDRVTGGGFGIGLEKNVRDAYNWLVENYSDADRENPDEVYIYGFSRGAYTARSLVGFIGECGLLRRGAPITVNELWEAYCILGREREKRTSVWDNLFKQPEAPMRSITVLATDPWIEEKYGVGAWILPPEKPLEKLLIHWSRRIQITYLGVYDTVGAIGWDALAIPGLRSRWALHNNVRPTTIIQQCRHALAIDENRSSFQHTAFVSYIGLGAADSETVRIAGGGSQNAVDETGANADKAAWEKSRRRWRHKIQQRWFVGAHSNIGGGYEDNRLAELPLQWLFDGAQLNLVEAPRWDPPPTAADQKPRDSFAEFAPPLWTKILRAKRNYRPIDPAPVLKASPGADSAAGDPSAGYSLESINEAVQGEPVHGESAFGSVLAYWEQSKLSLPPNLHEYIRRRGIVTTAAQPQHLWPGEGLSDCVALIVWATLAGAGFASLCELIGLEVTSGWNQWASYAAAFLFPFVDSSESLVNFKRACGFTAPAFSAFRDSVYWTRALGVVLFACGLVNSIHYFGLLGWRWNMCALGDLAAFYWRLPLLAAVAVILATKGSKRSWQSLVAGPAAIAGGAALVVGLSRLAGALFQARVENVPLAALGKHDLSPAGLLLVLQAALVYFWRALAWTRDPLAGANLGSIVKLQVCATPGQVRNCLGRWRRMLQCRWDADNPVTGPAAVRMRDVVGEALWRDMLGLIPVYTYLLMFGLWFGYASGLLKSVPQWSGGAPWWWLIPVVTATANYIEDACHLGYLRLDAKGANPGWGLTVLSVAMFAVKGAGLIVALAGVLGALAGGTWQVLQDLADWRARFAILISGGFLVVLAVYALGRAVHFFDKAPAEASTDGGATAARGAGGG